MPLKRGKSKRTIKSNFHDFRHGKTYARAVKKFGKAKANKILQAAVLSKARKRK